MTNFQKIAIDGCEYEISLPNKDTDYIQRKIAAETAPYEICMLRDMASRLSPGDLVLDVGANIGNHSLYLAAVAGCQVHAFEPNSVLCEAINKSVVRNKLDSRLSVSCIGVGREAANAHFGYTDESNLGAQSLAIGEGETDNIEIVRLDDLDFKQPVSAIKIDVEGMELDVLEGAAKLVECDCPALYIESQSEEHFNKIQDWVSRRGYVYLDTFNATPTHLFVSGSNVLDTDRIERLMAKLVRNEYQMKQQINGFRTNLNQANLKYRSASEHAANLKKELSQTLDAKSQLEEKNILFSQQVDRASQKYRQVTRQLASIRKSRSYRLAVQFQRGGKLIRAIARTLRRLLKFARELEGQRFRISAPSKSSHAQCLGSSAFSFESEAVTKLKQVPLRSLRVACIMDDFTYQSYLPECDLHALTPQSWERELQDCQPHLLFIESAWRGKDELWGSKVGHTSQELQGIVGWCREHDVPTVFWNKEDPVHFETFLNTARLFDFVFTTDIDCIGRYKGALQHDRVYLLPFACQPKINNPIEKFERADAFCFAGAYYARYPERARDLDNFIEHLSAYRPLEIYDRNYGKNEPDYQFPESYQNHIVGSLPFDQIDKAYKGYSYAINLNSIKQSQTMFARRVYELLASNTVTVSNYSRGVRLMFGDLVITTDDGGELIRRLEALANDDNLLLKYRLAGLRKVMREHTYQDRLAYILAKLKDEVVPELLPPVLVLGYAESKGQLDLLLNHFERQSYSDKRLLILAAAGLQRDYLKGGGRVRLISVSDTTGDAIDDWIEGDEWLASIRAEDYYGSNYLTDLVLATRYSEADAIGKIAHYAWSGESGVELLHPQCEYRPAQQVVLRSALIRSKCLAEKSVAEILHLLNCDEPLNLNVQAIDAFNYCKDGLSNNSDLETMTSLVDDSCGLEEGISLPELLTRAETVAPAKTAKDDAPIISGQQFASYFKPPAHKGYQFIVAGSQWRVVSTLPDGKHDYLYAVRDVTPSELGSCKNTSFYLEVTPGLSVQMVMAFLDKNKRRLNAEVRSANKNHEVPIPERTKYIRFGVRIFGSGSASINGLVLGHRKLNPAVVLGRSNYLMLTNHYPSSSDLYRNAFVHSRVLAYKEKGVAVDVFRLRNGEPLSHHEFQGVDVATGSQEALHELLSGGRYYHVLVHFLSPDMWLVLKQHVDRVKVTVWVHGAEIHPWYRRKCMIETPEQEVTAKRQSDVRMEFWRELLSNMPSNLKLIFVSKTFAEEVMEDLGFRLPEDQYSVIHNPIDTDLFLSADKSAEKRKKILSVRPFSSRIYANDLTVEAIRLLSKQPFFSDLEFRIVGDGRLFAETVAPIKDFENVVIEQRFLTREEISALHKEYGVFLCPSRVDTQGVSRDEAMASGLVPVTTAVAAIPEFVDDDCAILASSESPQALAEGVEYLYREPGKYVDMSTNAVKRVREQSGKAKIIVRELAEFSDVFV